MPNPTVQPAENQLIFALQPKQDDLLRLAEKDAAPTTIGFGGPLGGAKSGGLRRVLLQRALAHPGTAHLLMRRLSRQLVDNHIAPMFREYPILERFYLKSEKTLYLPNKSKLVFGYAENPAKDMQGDIYNYQGSEWATVGIDQAEQFNEEELTFIKARCRWPGLIGKLLLTFNPGGRGHQYLKRIFIDRKFEPNEHAEDFAFIQAFGWDNVEWVLPWLTAIGMTKNDYYTPSKFTDEQRKAAFLDHSDYGKVLAGLKGKMRQAYLEGDWEAFAGQFFDIWSKDEAVIEAELEPWWPRWVSIDWGYEHNAAVYWHAQADNQTITYRELVGQHIDPTQLGQMIGSMSKGEQVQQVYLGWDAFEISRKKWLSTDTVNDQIGRGLKEFGVPQPTRADCDRVGGWRLLYHLLSGGLWKIDSSCIRLIECLPQLQRSEDNREDVEKVDCDDQGHGGDDAADSARSGLKSRLSSREAPINVRVQNRIEVFVKSRDMTVQDLDPTAYAMMMRRAHRLERPKQPHRAFRPGRPYHGEGFRAHG